MDPPFLACFLMNGINFSALFRGIPDSVQTAMKSCVMSLLSWAAETVSSSVACLLLTWLQSILACFAFLCDSVTKCFSNDSGREWLIVFSHFLFVLFYSTGKRHQNENKTKTWGLLSCREHRSTKEHYHRKVQCSQLSRTRQIIIIKEKLHAANQKCYNYKKWQKLNIIFLEICFQPRFESELV